MGAFRLELKGGGRLERKLLEMAQQLGSGHSVKVGFLEGAKYPDGTPVAQVAFWQEFGTPNSKHPIPARAFMRTTVEGKSPRWPDQLARIAKATKYNSRATMASMGELIKGQIQHSINEWRDPPLATATVAAKGHAKPLIDTALMLRSVDYEVEENA